MLNEKVGFRRDWDVAEEHIVVADDLELEGLYGTVHLTRTSQGVYMEGELLSTHAAACVLCLREFPIPLASEIAELYSFPADSESEFNISEGGVLNFAPLMRELILLDEPIRPVCQPNCKGLCPDCGQDMNQSDCQCKKEATASRWSALGYYWSNHEDKSGLISAVKGTQDSEHADVRNSC